MIINDSPKDQESKETSQAEEYYDQPCKLDCPVCVKEVTTFLNEEYNYYIWLAVIVLFSVYGFLFGFPLVLLAMAICKDKVHTCPNCFQCLYIKCVENYVHAT